MAKVDVWEVVRGSAQKRIETFSLESDTEVEKFVERFNKVNYPSDPLAKRTGRYYSASRRISSGGIY